MPLQLGENQVDAEYVGHMWHISLCCFLSLDFKQSTSSDMCSTHVSYR